jgi:hypothetical protein
MKKKCNEFARCQLRLSLFVFLAAMADTFAVRYCLGYENLSAKADCQACHGWAADAAKWTARCRMARTCKRPSLVAKP